MIIFESLLNQASYYEAAGAVVEIGSSLKPKQPLQILTKLNLSKSVIPTVDVIYLT